MLRRLGEKISLHGRGLLDRCWRSYFKSSVDLHWRLWYGYLGLFRLGSGRLGVLRHSVEAISGGWLQVLLLLKGALFEHLGIR